MIVFEPIYYKGWFIQPTLDGYYACKRTDSSRPCLDCFPDVESAMAYIEERNFEEDKRRWQ